MRDKRHTIESTERQLRANLRHLQNLLCDENSLLELLAREFGAINRMNDTYSTTLAQDVGVELHCLNAFFKSTLGCVEEFWDEGLRLALMSR